MHHTNDSDIIEEEAVFTRRQVLSRTAASLLIGGVSIALSPQQSLAAASANNDVDEGMVSQSKLASLLKRIPTFAIVDANGVPYFVVGEDAKLTSYFFTSYKEAKRILDVAVKSSDKAIATTKKEIRITERGRRYTLKHYYLLSSNKQELL